jgi:hypothetical protein
MRADIVPCSFRIPTTPSFGFEPGKSLPFATPLQEWIWEDDTEDAITETFRRLSERIEASFESARPVG